jgi:DUF1365 family protein
MTTLNLASICFGEVIHKRTKPKVNAFRYKVFYLRIPMRSRRIDSNLLQRSGIGDNQFSWISFYDKDHGNGANDALAWVEGELKKANLTGIDGEIWLQTFPRVLGYVFNPVSFWYCHNATGQLRAIVAEVNNTFGDRHSYLLTPNHGDAIEFGRDITANKIFHVSPFFDVLGQYIFRFMRRETERNRTQDVSRIEYWLDEELQLTTSISGEEHPLTRKNVFRAILKFPLLCFGIMFKIHWQALKLWLKGAKFYSRPTPPSEQP